jgi:hypothetical protein
MLARLSRIEQSCLPPRDPTAVSWPTTTAAPILLHPPVLENEVNASLAEILGAITQSGVRTAKNPNTCKNRMVASSNGRCFAPRVLTITAKIAINIVMRVPCQRAGVYVGCIAEASSRMTFPAANDVSAIDACHPRAESQPTK